MAKKPQGLRPSFKNFSTTVHKPLSDKALQHTRQRNARPAQSCGRRFRASCSEQPGNRSPNASQLALACRMPASSSQPVRLDGADTPRPHWDSPSPPNPQRKPQGPGPLRPGRPPSRSFLGPGPTLSRCPPHRRDICMKACLGVE